LFFFRRKEDYAVLIRLLRWTDQMKWRYLRQISGLLIALSLILPESSCAGGGGTPQISYPTSGAETIGQLLLIIAIYLFPLAVTLTGRFRITLASVATAVSVLNICLADLGTMFSTVLVGWYVDITGVALYLLASFFELWGLSRVAAIAVLLGNAGFLLGGRYEQAGPIMGAVGGALLGALIGRATAFAGRGGAT
jgi:hypothetical protein